MKANPMKNLPPTPPGVTGGPAASRRAAGEDPPLLIERGLRAVESSAAGRRWAGSVRVAAAVGASGFVSGRGSIHVPARTRGAAERSLVSGEPVPLRDSLECWLAAALLRPLPTLLAARGPWHLAREAVAACARHLAAEVLPVCLEADAFLSVEASAPSLVAELDTLRRLARTSLPVLLVGETGVGKEIIARALHRASARPGRFVAENCAALPETLLEAELFGARRGAFTGAHRDRRGRVVQADRGTLFLDEIGDLPPPLQAKLLRVLQEREVRPLGAERSTPVDLRVVAATHRDLRSHDSLPNFREDLYFRIAGSICSIPPLRERRRDLPYLCAALLARIHEEGFGPGRLLTPEALDALCCRPCLAGNVRELDNLLRRASALSNGPRVAAELVADRSPPATGPTLETVMLREALHLASGVKSDAARRLGWSRQKLYRRMRALGIPARPSR
jgi:transcriptional regulator of acetoin/glycerol metabolism